MKKAYIYASPDWLEILLIKDDDLAYYKKYPIKFVPGTVYRTHISGDLDFLSGYEVDLGEDKAFIPKREMAKGRPADFPASLVYPPLEGKLARLSPEVKYLGDYMIYYPLEEGLFFSRSLDENFIQNAKEGLRKLGLGQDEKIIVRTRAQGKLDQLLDEYKLFKERRKALARRDNPLQLNPPEEVLLALAEARDIYTNSQEIFKEYRDFFGPRLKLQTSLDIRSISVYNEAVQKSLLRKISLPEGPELVIEELEALTVVDINSKHYRSRNRAEMAWEVNLLSTVELVSQIQIRGIRGIILVDYLRMNRKDTENLIDFLQDSLKTRHIELGLIGKTATGLIEMSIRS